MEEQNKALDDIISKLSEIQVKLMSVGIPSEDYNDISETIGNIKERLANIESSSQLATMFLEEHYSTKPDIDNPNKLYWKEDVIDAMVCFLNANTP